MTYIGIKIECKFIRPMKYTLYQVDAFASRVFEGNPAAVCIIDRWPDDLLMQKIASENNLSETAFALNRDDQFEIRWFTPAVEVDLCGHATLATAHVLFNHCDYPGEKIQFHSPRSGKLSVERSGALLTLNFPIDVLKNVKVPEALSEALGMAPVKAMTGRTDYLLVYSSQRDVETIRPDFSKLAGAGTRGVIVTAPGEKADFVSRFFAPGVGINEDPVTGSAHTSLIPYWSKELGKKRMTAYQVSARGGELICEYMGPRVKISGHAVTYMKGEIHF